MVSVGPSKDLIDLEAKERIAYALSLIRQRRALTHEERDVLLKRLRLHGLPDRREIERDLVDRFLDPREPIPPGWLNDMQQTWSDPIDTKSLFHLEPLLPRTTLEFKTAGLDGNIIGYKELSRPTGPQSDSTNSTSLRRQPADASSFIRGKSGHFPFAPGGITTGLDSSSGGDVVDELEKGFELTAGGVRTVPPGFSRGLDFGEQLQDTLDEHTDTVITPIYRPLASHTSVANGHAGPAENVPDLDKEIADLLPAGRLNLGKSKSRRRPVVTKRDWAHVVDVNQELLNFRDLVPDMAREYPFELDTFQKEAVFHLEQGDSVFVAAHTSAGKTVVAEYAIALAQRHMTRAIYTSPIKALSNQKFRDFKTTFGADAVGILTGDVQINPEAACLIMTTEILRSMLYKGADLIRDVEWVIFDEVHYINDLERGVVWEEVIIMLPDHVNIILLSATVPNTKEFADWVGRTKRKDIYVISTPKRPVPLEHHLYAARDIFKIVDARGEFLGSGIKDTSEALRRKQDKERDAAGLPVYGAPAGRGTQQQRGQRGGAQRGGAQRGIGVSHLRGRGGASTMAQRDRNLWVHLVGMLKKRDLLPVVAFTFSKKRCEENAASMPNTDLCVAAEKSEIHIVIERSLQRLKAPDRKLPQILRMRDLLARGVGVHHGGLLPIVKELVEILFSRGLVKVLFATETFAMGVNMPARTVVFAGIRKHDGRSFRDLLSGEYTQMSGRAGRRGLDATGCVIIVCDGDVPDVATLHKMILGQPNKLQSQFRLTYNMILNLLRVEALRVEEMIKRSFSENASQRLLPDQQRKVAEREKELRDLPKLDESEHVKRITQIYDLNHQLVQLNGQIVEEALSQGSSAKVTTPGRFIVLSDGHYHSAPALLLRQAPVLRADDAGVLDRTRNFYVLAFVSPAVKAGDEDLDPEAIPPVWPPALQGHGEHRLTYEFATVPASSIAFMTNKVHKVDAETLISKARKSDMDAILAEIQPVLAGLSQPSGLEEMDYSKIRSLAFREFLQARSEKLALVRSIATDDIVNFDELYHAVHAQRVLGTKIANLRLVISDQNLELLPDYEQRIAVLQDMQFIDASSTVLLKGRVACEINSAHELILTEAILENVFGSYEPDEVVALLSSFVFTEKTDNEPFLTPRLGEGKDQLVEIAERVAQTQSARHADSSVGVGSGTELKFGLIEVVYEWARGMPFHQITQLTDVQEGTIVRAITRLDETCREVRDAARIIGDADLYQKMEACQACIRRDVVFCASLWI